MRFQTRFVAGELRIPPRTFRARCDRVCFVTSCTWRGVRLRPLSARKRSSAARPGEDWRRVLAPRAGLIRPNRILVGFLTKHPHRPALYFAMAEDGFLHASPVHRARACVVPSCCGAVGRACSRSADLRDPPDVCDRHLFADRLRCRVPAAAKRRDARHPVRTLLSSGSARSGDRALSTSHAQLMARVDVAGLPYCSGGGTDELPAALWMLPPRTGRTPRPARRSRRARIDPAPCSRPSTPGGFGTRTRVGHAGPAGIVPAREWLASELAALGKDRG